MPEPAIRAEGDLARRRVGLLVWGLPFVAILATASDVPSVTRGLVWALSLLWAGVACGTNAYRSGRLHCFITGPFFIALSAASLLHGIGALPLGTHGWRWIGVALAVGTPLLTVVPEWIWGTYSARGEGRCC